MAIDIRASIFCSLGELISAELSDDYIQENGLIKTTGNCEINGLVNPAPGSIVTFSYQKNGRTYQIPRKMRVIGSFADPYRGITQVELGCKLSYLSNLVPRPEVDGESEKETGRRQWCLNGYVDYPADFDKGAFPISADYLMRACLTKLGITASSYPLQSWFFVDSFDLSPGYVQVLSDLLLSESYLGYLNYSENLIVIPLKEYGDPAAALLDESRTIDIGPINIGEPPAENVYVKYTTIKLSEKNTDENQAIDVPTILSDREISESVASPVYHYVRYGVNRFGTIFNYTATAAHAVRRTTTTIYGTDKSFDENTCYIWGIEGADLSSKPIRRIETESVCLAEAANNYCAQQLSLLDGNFDVSVEGEITTVTEYEYDSRGEMIYSIKEVYEPFFKFAGGLNLDFVFANNAYLIVGTSPILMEREIIKRQVLYAQRPTFIQLEAGQTFEPAIGGERVFREKYVNFSKTPQGQQGIAQIREFSPFGTANAALEWLFRASRTMVYLDGDITTSRNRTLVGGQIRPPRQLDIPGSANSEDAPSVEDVQNIAFILGSPPDSGSFVEFSIPYQSDDRYDASGNIIRGSQLSQALKFGRIQNKLLHGNRYGMNIQTIPEYIPHTPFAPFAIQASGATALYRVNGMTWTMDSSGLVVGVDGLFWSGLGGTSVPWFPVADGIVSLPSTPATSDTSPTAYIGTVLEVTEDPQAFLTSTFPTAVSGDGIVDEDTNNVWTYDGSTWTNVGENPGPIIDASITVPVWKEIVILEPRVRLKPSVLAREYATTLPGYDFDAKLKVEVFSSKSVRLEIRIPEAIESVCASLPPSISTGAAVFITAATILSEAFTPVVSSGASAFVPAISINIKGIAPSSVGRPALVVDVPVAAVQVSSGIPVIASGVALGVSKSDLVIFAIVPSIKAGAAIVIPSTSLTISALIPENIGQVIEVSIPLINLAISGLASTIAIGASVKCPSTTIGLSAIVPEFVGILAQEQEPGLTLLLEDDLLSLLDF